MVIPTGLVDALVVIDPVDDALVEGSESVELSLAPGAGYAVGAASQDAVVLLDNDIDVVTHMADSEETVHGAVTAGDLASTYGSDGVYEVITEEPYNGSKRSRLEHAWSFSVTGGSSATLLVEAFRPNALEDFVVSYSLDGASWIDAFAITKSFDDDLAQDFSLPAGTSGTVFVRVTDTDRSRPEGSLESVFVDRLVIVTTP